MKRILSFILILSICFVQAGVVEAENKAETAYAVQDLYDLGIMKGDAQGNLNAEKDVTRAEFTALVVRAMARENSGGVQSFCDVPYDHWANENIAFATEREIIEGYGNGYFGPDDKVTFSQAVKMLLSVLNRVEEGFSYPQDYMMEAAKCGLTFGINLLPEDALTREDAALLILNALYIPNANGNLLLDTLECKTYYVSPDGDDSADGSHLRPWKSLARAAQTVSGYSVIFVEEGVYYESAPACFASGGESVKKPLTVKNRKGEKVRIVYEGLEEDAALTVTQNADFITVKNLSITSNGYGVKVENADNVTIEKNEFLGGKAAVSIYGGSNASVCGNVFENQTESCVNICGCAKQSQIYNNEFLTGELLSEAAIVLESHQDAAAVENCVIWNNIFFDKKENTHAAGVIYGGTENCCFYNNIIEGTEGGIIFKGDNINPVLKNNIYSQCSDNAYIYNDAPRNIDSDYNCFYLSYPQMKEKNSKQGDPYFVSKGNDWRLMSVSPAAGSGIAVSPIITNADGDSLALDMRDFEGNKRGETWHMGIYSTVSGETILDEVGALDTRSVMLSLDFRKGADHMVASGGDWVAEAGSLWQNSTAKSRTTICYDGGEKWSDYEYSADVESSAAVDGNATGIIFRADLEMKNMYTFRFLSNDMLEFAKWQEGSFASIDKWEYGFNTDTIYSLKVRAEGDKFTFYVNGEKVREVQDGSFNAGTVGLYCYREINRYDNLKVVSVN